MTKIIKLLKNLIYANYNNKGKIILEIMAKYISNLI